VQTSMTAYIEPAGPGNISRRSPSWSVNLLLPFLGTVQYREGLRMRHHVLFLPMFDLFARCFISAIPKRASAFAATPTPRQVLGTPDNQGGEPSMGECKYYNDII
jgi:hypothetical protein